MKEKKTYKSSWYEFTPDWSGFALRYELSGYYDYKPVLQIYFIWGKLFLYLPWRHYKKVKRDKTIKEKRKDKLDKLSGKVIKEVYKKELYYDSEPPRYGIYFYMNQFGINIGEKTKLYDLPWSLDWIRTSALKIDGTWISENKNNRNCEFWDDTKWKDILFIEKYPYRYITKDGTLQECDATIKVNEREWRWKWFKWLKYTGKTYKTIEVNFSKEIGEKVNSWKGGTTGCSYEMKKNETPYQTLKRMENERRFN